MEIPEDKRKEIAQLYYKWYMTYYLRIRLTEEINNLELTNREFENIISRYYFGKYNNYSNNYVYNKLLKELNEKRFYIEEYTLRNIMKEKVEPPKFNFNINIYTDDNNIYFEFMDLRFSCYKYIFLTEENQLKYDYINILKLILRYEPLYPKSGEFWSLPLSVHEHLAGFPRDVVECFASPFNHYSPNYFSMFEEDKDFGALGSFLKDWDKYDFTGKTLLVDPPYLENIINDSCFIVEKLLDKYDDLIIISLMPFWKDVKGLNDLSNNKYLTNKTILRDKYNIHSFVEGKNIEQSRVKMLRFIFVKGASFNYVIDN